MIFNFTGCMDIPDILLHEAVQKCANNTTSIYEAVCQMFEKLIPSYPIEMLNFIYIDIVKEIRDRLSILRE